MGANKEQSQFAESQEGENIYDNPRSWIAWKREAERLKDESRQDRELAAERAILLDMERNITASLREREKRLREMLADLQWQLDSTGEQACPVCDAPKKGGYFTKKGEHWANCGLWKLLKED